jgi:hypothetical protein
VTDCAASAMGKDKIRYLVFINGRWRWRPKREMRLAGFQLVNLSKGYAVEGENYPSAEDKARAISLNEDWDRYRRGVPSAVSGTYRYPHGSVGDGYHRAMQMREQERKDKGIVRTREQISRDDWPRAWKWIEPLFGDCDPKTVTPEQVQALRGTVKAKISESEAHRVIKVWRALWKKMGAFKYCDPNQDPSFAFANTAPEPRQAVWSEAEAAQLAKRAWREGYKGLTACLAVAWDSMLSPVDVRTLKADQLQRDQRGEWFELARAKTGNEAFGTISRRSGKVLHAYRQMLPDLLGSAPIFRNRAGRAYTKDCLGDDFRAVRTLAFGEEETRQLADFRRSGSVEALAGGATAEKLSVKMANSISASVRLQKTYLPNQVASVRDIDEARRVGRAKLREQKGVESVTAPARKYHTGTVKRAKSLK